MSKKMYTQLRKTGGNPLLQCYPPEKSKEKSTAWRKVNFNTELYRKIGQLQRMLTEYVKSAWKPAGANQLGRIKLSAQTGKKGEEMLKEELCKLLSTDESLPEFSVKVKTWRKCHLALKITSCIGVMLVCRFEFSPCWSVKQCWGAIPGRSPDIARDPVLLILTLPSPNCSLPTHMASRLHRSCHPRDKLSWGQREIHGWGLENTREPSVPSADRSWYPIHRTLYALYFGLR